MLALPANQVMNYFHVFISLLIVIYLVVIRIIALHQEHPCHLFGLWNIVFPATLNFVPHQLNSRQNSKFHGHHVESSLSLLMLSSVHSTIIITNTLINQAGSYYVITNFYLIWDRRQLYPITQMISLLLHSTLALPRSHIITTISSLAVTGYN